jgi:anti-sigma-K factor RskA
MIDERTEELAALHALDLLEGDEKAAFEARLAADSGLQAMVRDLRDPAAALAFAAPAVAPPPELRARLLEKIGRSAPREAGGDSAKLIPFRLPLLIPWAAAAVFAFAAAWLGQSLLASREEAENLRTESRLAQLALRDAENRQAAERIILGQQLTNASQQLADVNRQLADARSQAAAASRDVADLTKELQTQADLAQFKITTLASMLGNSSQALAVAVWNPARQEGVLTVQKLPQLARDQDYQLWVVDPKYQNPVNGGVFTVDADGVARFQFKPDQPITAVAAFAVTRERKGGVPKAEGPFVLLGK